MACLSATRLSCGLDLLSSRISSSLVPPRTPPRALMSSTAIWMWRLPISPCSAAGPLNGSITAMRMFSAAGTAPHPRMPHNATTAPRETRIVPVMVLPITNYYSSGLRPLHLARRRQDVVLCLYASIDAPTVTGIVGVVLHAVLANLAKRRHEQRFGDLVIVRPHPGLADSRVVAHVFQRFCDFDRIGRARLVDRFCPHV